MKFLLFFTIFKIFFDIIIMRYQSSYNLPYSWLFPKFLTCRIFFLLRSKFRKELQKCKKILTKVIRIQKTHQIHFIWKEKTFPDYSLKILLLFTIFRYFLTLLLCEINVLTILHIVNFFQNFLMTSFFFTWIKIYESWMFSYHDFPSFSRSFRVIKISYVALTKFRKEFQNCTKILNVIRIQKTHQIHFIWKEKTFPDYSLKILLLFTIFRYLLTLLLCEINFLTILHIVNFFQNFLMASFFFTWIKIYEFWMFSYHNFPSFSRSFRVIKITVT